MMPGHGVDRLEKRAEALAEIGNLDAVSRAEQDDHRFANDAAEPEQNRGDNSGKRSRHEHAPDGLQAIRAQRVGGFLEAARHVAQRIFREGENGRDGHQREECSGGKNIQPFADREKRNPAQPMRLRGGANRFPDDGDAEKPKHDRRNRGDEFDVRFDQSFLAARRDFAHVNRRGDANRDCEDERDRRDHDRADQQWPDAVPILPKTGRDPIASKQERA